jgi:hypothetical protein
MMLTADVEVCASILAGRPVRAGGLDAFVLRRALPGGPLRDSESFIYISAAMLAAVAEAGPLRRRGKERP